MEKLFKLNNYLVVDLFEIELEPSEGYFRFHGSKNFNKNLIFQGNQYIFIPCEFSSFESSSEGKQSRPSLKIANINNYFSKILKDRNDLIGKKIFRKKILGKDLDLSNFTDDINPFGVSAFNTYIANDKFIINLKTRENKEEVILELSTKIDIESLNLPNRKITNDTCGWNYRCFGCNYGNTSNYAGPKINSSAPSLGLQPSSNYFKNASWLGDNTSPDPGVPIADENDKTFLGSYKANLNNSTYNLSTLTYKGEWSPNVIYNIGDFVYVDPIASIDIQSETTDTKYLIKPKSFYVCISNDVLGKFPENNTNVWKQDKCSKTLRGCLLRFQDFLSSNDGYLPFGAFPATFPYDNEAK
jgi:lambda family phage minor tail protein L